MSEEQHDDDFDDLDESEREALQQDLLDVQVLKKTLGGRGIKGVVVWCPDCEDDHFLGWDLLAGNLEEMLVSGSPPVHEPAWEPDPDEYVTWEYARGFLDGTDIGSPGTVLVRCDFCGTDLPDPPYVCDYCPRCGSSLAPVRLLVLLHQRGMDAQEIADLFSESGLALPVVDPKRPELDLDELDSIFEEDGEGDE